MSAWALQVSVLVLPYARERLRLSRYALSSANIVRLKGLTHLAHATTHATLVGRSPEHSSHAC